MTPERIVPGLVVGAVNVIALAVGLGKSTLAEKLIISPLVQARFDLVVYLAAQTRVLDERVASLKPGSDTHVLRPRPRRMCGPLDAAWTQLERSGCGALARRELCSMCPPKRGCRWPGQLGGLHDNSVVMGTQAYCRCAPLSLAQRIRAAQAPLVILDEDLALMQPFKHVLAFADLERHATLVEQVLGEPMSGANKQILLGQQGAVVGLLDPDADPRDLPPVKPLPPEVAARVQERGLARFGDGYAYRGTDLFLALLSSRFRTSDDGLGYILRPWLGGATVVLLSAEVDPLIIRHRLGRQVTALFPPRHTQHAGTKVYNVCDRRLSASRLPGHLPHLAVPYAQLIERERVAGRRVLLLTRKKHRGIVSSAINEGLRRIGSPGLRAVGHDELTGAAGEDPVISYGVQGTNSFQYHDTAICVGAYNVAPRAVAELLNDAHRPDEELEVEVTYAAGRRTARTLGTGGNPNMDDLAWRYLHQIEFNTANQAAGRVRFCTRPRTVIFAQQTDLPYELEATFERFAGFRQHFGLHTARELGARERGAWVREAKADGLTQVQAVERTGLSLSTVKRRWRG